MLKKIVVAVLGLLVLFAGFVATRPASFRIERSVSVRAPAELAFAHLGDFRNFGAWSPWDKLDPGMKKAFDGPEQGVGATYSWAGNDQVGEGRMTITEVKPNEEIRIKLEFIKPFATTNTTLFLTKASATKTDETTVHWIMEGENDFLGKAASLFMDIEKMVGGDFEKGLGALKPILEAESEKRRAEAKSMAEAQKDDEVAKDSDLPAPDADGARAAEPEEAKGASEKAQGDTRPN